MDGFLLPFGAAASVATVLRISIASFLFSFGKSASASALVNLDMVSAISPELLGIRAGGASQVERAGAEGAEVWGRGVVGGAGGGIAAGLLNL
jgi:hypothetical protein